MSKHVLGLIATAILAGSCGWIGAERLMVRPSASTPTLSPELEAEVNSAEITVSARRMYASKPPEGPVLPEFERMLKSKSGRVRADAASLLADFSIEDRKEAEQAVRAAFEVEKVPRMQAELARALLRFDPNNRAYLNKLAKDRAAAGDERLQKLLEWDDYLLDLAAEDGAEIKRRLKAGEKR